MNSVKLETTAEDKHLKTQIFNNMDELGKVMS